MDLAESIFQTAVAELRGQQKRQSVIDKLLEHQRIVLQGQVARSFDLVEDCLIALGVSNAELLANLTRAD